MLSETIIRIINGKERASQLASIRYMFDKYKEKEPKKMVLRLMNFCKDIARISRILPNVGWCNFLIADNRNLISNFRSKKVE